jgi:hypothetical protein
MSNAATSILSSIAPFTPPSLPASSRPTTVFSANNLAGSLLLGAVDPGCLYTHLSADEIHPVPGHYPPLARIDPEFAHALWGTLRHIAAVILCAGNGISPHEAARNAPRSIPSAALAQIGLPVPAIIAVEALGSRNPLLVSRTIGDQYFTLRTLQYAGRGGIAWLSAAVERSATLGDESLWRWAYGLSIRPPYAVSVDAIHAALHRELQGVLPPAPYHSRQVSHHPLNPSLARTPAAADLCQFLIDRASRFSSSSDESSNPSTPRSSPVVPAISITEDDLTDLADDLSLDDEEERPLLIFD